jgi:DNA-binding NarL/FixJ family response regulator
MRQAVCRYVQMQFPQLSCFEATDGEQAIDLVEKTNPTFIILELALRRMSGLRLIRRIRETNKNVPLLVVTIYDERIHAAKVLNEGANGYLMKHDVPEKLREAVTKIMDGKRYFPFGAYA